MKNELPSDVVTEGAPAVAVQRLVRPPTLERWECFRLAHLNGLHADNEMERAREWRERAARRGIRWQKQVAFAIDSERSARLRYARAREWKEYGKTVAA